MQELIEKLKENQEIDEQTLIEFLEKEKSQIVGAWAEGCFKSKPGDCGTNYYESKFTKDLNYGE